MQMFRYQTLGAGGNGRIFTKSWKPLNERLLAEPGKLALGVAARSLGDRFGGGSAGDSSLKMRAQFAISDEIEWFGIERHAAVNKPGNFFQPASIEHRVHALFNALIQRGSRRLKPDLHRGVPFEACPTRSMDFRKCTSRQQAYFNGANHLGAIAGPNTQRGGRVPAAQHTMQILERMLVRTGFQARSQYLGTRRGIGQAF